MSSWLGHFYNTPVTAMINAGSRNASDAGLYNFTTTMNQINETNSVVDFGFHYVTMGTNGVPLDNNTNGIADYLEGPFTNKLNQTITFDTIPNKTYGNAPFALSASASSGLPVTFSVVSGPATLSGNTITLTGAGRLR